MNKRVNQLRSEITPLQWIIGGIVLLVIVGGLWWKFLGPGSVPPEPKPMPLPPGAVETGPFPYQPPTGIPPNMPGLNRPTEK
jgi:hypothetical protein